MDVWTIRDIGGLYYKLMMIVNDDSRFVNKLEASLADDARVVIYDRHMFIVQATDVNAIKLFSSSLMLRENKLKCFQSSLTIIKDLLTRRDLVSK